MKSKVGIVMKNLLLTGPPGCGKTTLLEKVIERTRVPCIGFVTKEIREAGRRKGFK